MIFTVREKTVLCSLVAVLAGAIFSAPSAAPNTKSCRVGEVIRVLSPASFQCRLSDYAYGKSIRFQVYVRGIFPGDASEQHTAFLAELLKKAGRIELRNAEFRNYFRIKADVWVDGKNLSQLLICQNPALASEKEEAVPETIQRPAPYRPPVGVSGRQTGGSPQDGGAAQVRKITLQGLLDTTVDCSALRTDTPFSEAIDLLCGSVTPHLPLVILWGDLEANARIDKETPIGVEGFKQMRLGQALETVLRSVAAGQTKLVLAAEGGVLTLGTRQGLPEKNKTRVYSIEDLLLAPSGADEENQTGAGGQNRGYGR
ncbi:MAG: hypothetical protein L0Y36_02760 [Planctomycetales bacterium]|nr:hypothetical protein [Planctomycetales bacterium]